MTSTCDRARDDCSSSPSRCGSTVSSDRCAAAVLSAGPPRICWSGTAKAVTVGPGDDLSQPNVQSSEATASGPCSSSLFEQLAYGHSPGREHPPPSVDEKTLQMTNPTVLVAT